MFLVTICSQTNDHNIDVTPPSVWELIHVHHARAPNALIALRVICSLAHKLRIYRQLVRQLIQ